MQAPLSVESDPCAVVRAVFWKAKELHFPDQDPTLHIDKGLVNKINCKNIGSLTQVRVFMYCICCQM